MKNSEERHMFNLWIVSLVVTFLMTFLGLIFNNLIIALLSVISGIIALIIFILLIDKIVSAIEKKKERSYKQLKAKIQLEEEENSDKDLFNKRYNSFIEKINNAETTKELESILEEMSVSKLVLNRDTKSVDELKKRIQSKYEELVNES